MGKRSGGGAGGGRGGGAAGAASPSALDLGQVTFNGEQTDLTGKVLTKWQAGDRAQLEVEISAKGILGGRAFGSVVFNVDAGAKTAKIVSINSIQALRGQRVGERLYGAAFAQAKLRGVTTFTSDSRVSLPAANTWRSIGRKLGGVTESRSTNDGQQLIGSGGKPVFSINLGKVSQSKLDGLGR